MPRHFTPSEVESLIPLLEHIFGQLTVVLQDAERTRRELVDASPLRAEALRSVLEGLGQRASALVSRVSELGGQLKDIERGLVDFPCRRGGETVLLCWQFGEKSLGYWHGEDEGFAGRKPLDAAPQQVALLLN